METHAEGGLEYPASAISTFMIDDAQIVADLIENKFKKLNGRTSTM